MEDTLERIEKKLKECSSLPEDKKQELINLFENLKKEVLLLQSTHHDDAVSIAGYTEFSLREAIREEKSPELLKHSVEGLSLSAQKFEISHPGLTGLVNAIGHTLVNIGI